MERIGAILALYKVGPRKVRDVIGSLTYKQLLDKDDFLVELLRGDWSHLGSIDGMFAMWERELAWWTGFSIPTYQRICQWLKGRMDMPYDEPEECDDNGETSYYPLFSSMLPEWTCTWERDDDLNPFPMLTRTTNISSLIAEFDKHKGHLSFSVQKDVSELLEFSVNEKKVHETIKFKSRSLTHMRQVKSIASRIKKCAVGLVDRMDVTDEAKLLCDACDSIPDDESDVEFIAIENVLATLEEFIQRVKVVENAVPVSQSLPDLSDGMSTKSMNEEMTLCESAIRKASVSVDEEQKYRASLQLSIERLTREFNDLNTKLKDERDMIKQLNDEIAQRKYENTQMADQLVEWQTDRNRKQEEFDALEIKHMKLSTEYKAEKEIQQNLTANAEQIKTDLEERSSEIRALEEDIVLQREDNSKLSLQLSELQAALENNKLPIVRKVLSDMINDGRNLSDTLTRVDKLINDYCAREEQILALAKDEQRQREITQHKEAEARAKRRLIEEEEARIARDRQYDEDYRRYLAQKEKEDAQKREAEEKMRLAREAMERERVKAEMLAEQERQRQVKLEKRRRKELEREEMKKKIAAIQAKMAEDESDSSTDDDDVVIQEVIEEDVREIAKIEDESAAIALAEKEKAEQIAKDHALALSLSQQPHSPKRVEYDSKPLGQGHSLNYADVLKRGDDHDIVTRNACEELSEELKVDALSKSNTSDESSELEKPMADMRTLESGDFIDASEIDLEGKDDGPTLMKPIDISSPYSMMSGIQIGQSKRMRDEPDSADAKPDFRLGASEPKSKIDSTHTKIHHPSIQVTEDSLGSSKAESTSSGLERLSILIDNLADSVYVRTYSVAAKVNLNSVTEMIFEKNGDFYTYFKNYHNMEKNPHDAFANEMLAKVNSMYDESQINHVLEAVAKDKPFNYDAACALVAYVTGTRVFVGELVDYTDKGQRVQRIARRSKVYGKDSDCIRMFLLRQHNIWLAPATDEAEAMFTYLNTTLEKYDQEDQALSFGKKIYNAYVATHVPATFSDLSHVFGRVDKSYSVITKNHDEFVTSIGRYESTRRGLKFDCVTACSTYNSLTLAITKTAVDDGKKGIAWVAKGAVWSHYGIFGNSFVSSTPKINSAMAGYNNYTRKMQPVLRDFKLNEIDDENVEQKVYNAFIKMMLVARVNVFDAMYCALDNMEDEINESFREQNIDPQTIPWVYKDNKDKDNCKLITDAYLPERMKPCIMNARNRGLDSMNALLPLKNGWKFPCGLEGTRNSFDDHPCLEHVRAVPTIYDSVSFNGYSCVCSRVYETKVGPALCSATTHMIRLPFHLTEAKDGLYKDSRKPRLALRNSKAVSSRRNV